jgi:hypothetical protein
LNWCTTARRRLPRRESGTGAAGVGRRSGQTNELPWRRAPKTMGLSSNSVCNLMASYAFVVADLKCSQCDQSIADMVWFKWGYCPGQLPRHEYLYRVGDSLQWKRCDDGSIRAWAFFNGDGLPLVFALAMSDSQPDRRLIRRSRGGGLEAFPNRQQVRSKPPSRHARLERDLTARKSRGCPGRCRAHRT